MKTFTLLSAIACTVLSVAAQSQVWGQCGGIGWSGATTCVSGSTCTKLNDYYYQCIPGASQPTSVSSSKSISISSIAPPPTSRPSPPPTSSPVPPPTTTASGPAPTGSQIRSVTAPVFHFYLQNHNGAPVLGPEASAGLFTISGTITLNQPGGSKLYLNANTSATTSYKPLTLDTTAKTTNWALEGDTIITSNPRELNFLACATSDANYYTLYLQEGNDQPAGASCTLQTLHLPCLC